MTDGLASRVDRSSVAFVAEDNGGRSAASGVMSVDVEEAYHAAALAQVAPRSAWDGMESRVVDNTGRILDAFARAGVRATFFILGSVGQRHPALVRAIADAGHEVASHGWAHYRIGEQTPTGFLEDVRRTKQTLEDCAGQPVIGYRAANFSMTEGTWWAYDALVESGYRYSSSVNPLRHDHYGLPSAPRVPFTPRAGIVEIPMTTLTGGGRRWPMPGGGWFRLLPYAMSREGIRRARAAGARPIFYFHPWEIDPGQSRLRPAALARFRHYVNLSGMALKLERVLGDFAWDRMDQVYADVMGNPPRPWSPASAPGVSHATATGESEEALP